MVPLQRLCRTRILRAWDAKVRAEVARGAPVEPRAPSIGERHARSDGRRSNLVQQRPGRSEVLRHAIATPPRGRSAGPTNREPYAKRMPAPQDPSWKGPLTTETQLQLVAVEDSVTDAEIVARHLANAGLKCHIHRVQTEREFASALQEIQPDLILSDFSLPEFDGLRALEIASAHAPHVPFIFVSGTIGEERAVEALRNGATDYVLKSNLSRLASAVECALHEASLREIQRRADQLREQEIESVTDESHSELRQQLATLEEALRTRTATVEHANAQLREQVRLREAVEVELGLARKLEAVGRLAAGIAHEINTPIQYIGDSVHFLGSAFSEMLALAAAGVSDTDSAADLQLFREEVPRAIDRITEGAQRVATIVRAMKEFAHPDATEKAPADLNRAIETTLLVAGSEYKYVATVHLYLGEVPEVICNVGELGQVFLNLIVNAAHALADAGRDAGSGRIFIRTALVEGWVELQFEDNGCGIPMEIIDKIYDPFFTTKEVGRGSGQGLAIARSIVVDKHGGRIHVASTAGVGTCFTLRLPVDSSVGIRS